MIVIEVIATILVLVGAFYISIPRVEGLVLMAIAQILWIIFGVINNHYVFTAQGIALLCFNIWGMYNWKEKGIGQ